MATYARSSKAPALKASEGAGPAAAQAVRAGILPFNARAAVRHLKKVDPVLGRAIDRVGPFRLVLQPLKTPFSALARSIVYQQLSGKAAGTIFGRVKALFPGSDELEAKDLPRVSDEVLRGAGLSRNKLLALRDLSAKCLDGTVPSLEELETLDNEQIIERLTVVRGVGRWTAEMVLIFRLGRPDVLAVDDLGLRKGFALAFGKRALPSPEQLARHGRIWAPYRTVASWYLWRVLDTPMP
jgi:3-methyladenine DNA glycosylase/8-oxoguanine DNA glycosylase